MKRRKPSKGWHKIAFRMFQCKRTDMYDAIIFGAPKFQMWAWAVWRSGGVTSGMSCSLEQARRHANFIIANLERIRNETS